MAKNKKSENRQLFYKYVTDCISNEYNSQLKSNSLADLYKLAGFEIKNEDDLTREEHLALVMPKIPQYMHKRIMAMEVLRSDLKEFSTDCDETFFYKTEKDIKSVLSLFQKDNIEEVKIRLELHNLRYDIDEQLNPNSRYNRFQILKQIVKETKHNDGQFDHNPLNITAKRMEYFMKSMPVDERLTLLDSIIKKTRNKDAYDYMKYKSTLKKEKLDKDKENKLLDQEEKQYRYDQIMQTELREAPNNQEKIKLCKEALNLVRYKEWGRAKKFQAKIRIYDSLVSLYLSEGMQKEYEDAKYIRQSYEKALDNNRSYGAKKGYGYGR
ncbi:MAG: hypothetical protein IJ019_01270 [Alphaproteobacteria bacterium]|nr:hypothetical protein [Alphaproteobacteria bacterium]